MGYFQVVSISLLKTVYITSWNVTRKVLGLGLITMWMAVLGKPLLKNFMA